MIARPAVYPPAQPIWCAGCGHFAVLNAVRTVMSDLELAPHEVLTLAGIGCSGTMQNYLGTYGYHALHGRVLPTATGAALANPDLTVIAVGGDGDGYAIGMGHLVHAFRRNVSFVYMLINNEVYGLTKGQPSPGSFLDEGAREHAVMGPLLGLSIPATSFVARGYSGAFDQLVRLTRAAFDHARGGHGFAFLEVISPCVTYADTYARWEKALSNVDEDPGYDPSDRIAAFATGSRLAAEGRLPTGLLYRAAAASPASRPTPAHADLDPRNRKFHDILDRYAIRSEVRPPPQVAAGTVQTTLGLINSCRLPGQPPASQSDVETDLAAAGSALVVAGDADARGVAYCVSNDAGTELCWLCAQDERPAVRGMIERVLERGAARCTGAFNLPTRTTWGIPGLSVERRPETHAALLELGFEPRQKWLYMRGKPALRAPRLADQIVETQPNQWLLRILHCNEPVAEVKVELGAGGKGMVRWIAVAEALRGQGLGRGLFDQATRLLGSKGANEVALFVIDDEKADGEHAVALNLYRRAGFYVSDHLAGYVRVSTLPWPSHPG